MIRVTTTLRFAVPMLILAAALFASMAASPAAAQAGICAHPGTSRIDHVVVIAFENHSYQQVLGRSAPRSYFKNLAASCGSATRFRAARVPSSLPSYIAVTSGVVSITHDCVPGPGCWARTRSIFGQLGAHNWRAWAESMPGRCVARNAGRYVSRHVPAIYFSRIPRRVCRANMVPLTQWAPTPQRKFIWVAPNLQHDMHDGTLAQASKWLQNFLAGPRGLLRTASYQAGHTAIFVWFDTGDSSASLTTPIPMIAVSKHVPHRRFTRVMNNYQLLRTWEGMFRLPCLNHACAARSLRAIFHM